ncbi:CubicO group peptidase (beta-lactamase class C family) [Mucilaginibacter frigoritolerans]|uniref:CubicO group peptidase (Beta-lactamase class C family) n=1 Tax=Mucilaginibacter frigoritolerans TaxID=652788 RepID=A0A562U0Z8_9SPHI|nr:serine hydrolase domain-containing protein [Mucilaginibacter frigoritolerans]TWI99487.1 CubicO group peptidase (beta-lactamase class C family) [Mucilaginibacter frigoritolerans]
MKTIRRLANSIMTLLFFLIGQNLSAQQIKDQPVGRLAVKLVEAINTGDKDFWSKFISEHIDLQAQRNGETAKDILNNFKDLFIETGGVQISSMREGRDPDEVQLTLNLQNGGKPITMFTHLSRESDQMLIGFIIRKSEDGEVDNSSRGAMPAQKMPADSNIMKEVQQLVDKAAANDKYSGAVLIAKGNRVLLTKAYGFANADKKILNNTETKFNLGSMNKMFTGVAIAQLVQVGKLNFDDKLIKILPDYPNKDVAKKITIEQLLTHTSGLGDFFKPEFFANIPKYVNLNDYLPLYVNEPLLFEPGEGWAYSNAGFITLGLVIEKISGEDYFTYVREHIFNPAEMRSSDWYIKEVDVPNLATGYTFGEHNDPQNNHARKNNIFGLPVRGTSAGGGYSTTGDMLKFVQALLGHKLLNAQYTQTVITGKVDDHHPNSKYAYGFMDRVENGKHIIGHNGGGPGINGYVMMIPDNGFTIIVLGNFDPPSADNLGKSICDKISIL